MTHLKIQQKNVSEGGSVENVSGQLISALYTLSKDGNLVYDSTDLKGDLQVSATYQKYITELHTQYPGLNITALSYYLFFEDKVIESYWANSEYGDGIGISTTSAQSVSQWPRRHTEYNGMGLQNPESNSSYNGGKFAFQSDPTITSFDELGQFTNITSIPGACFRGSSLQSIDLSNITEIQALAFRDTQLSGVINVPNLRTLSARNWNITNYNGDGGQFRSNPSITELNLSSNISSAFKIDTIPEEFVAYCTSLAKVTGLENVYSISTGAFYGCTSLESVDLTNNVTTIGNSSFYNSGIICADLTNVTSIGSNAFQNTHITSTSTWDHEQINSSATSLTINSSVINQDAFKGVRFSPTVISLPNISNLGPGALYGSNVSQVSISNISALPNATFQNCSNLTTVTGLSQCTSIGEYAFYRCSILRSVDLNWNNITTISRNAFEGCTSLSLQNISIPNLTTLGTRAFWGVTSITTISNLGQIGTLSSGTFGGCSQLSSITLPSSLRTLYCSAFNETLIDVIIGNQGLTTMELGQLKTNHIPFKYVEVPSTVTDMRIFFHRSLEQYQQDNTAVCVVKATTPPTLGYYVAGGSVTYDENTRYAAKDDTGDGAKRFLGIYVPDSSLSAYLAAPGAWQHSEIQARLKPISQLQTDSPSNWAIYQAGLSS